jgi:malonyl-CoA/methylmalonyl-CoA synthetase
MRAMRPGERRGGTVGFPLPGVACACRATTGRPAVGEIGGIQVKGPNVFKGYWRMPEKTAEEFTADGWFKTGDVGKQDERGYVTIVGRSKDLIISGGYNVYPAEIEGYINELPGVAESALCRRAAPGLRRVGVAVVMPSRAPSWTRGPDGRAEVAASSKLANFKMPKRCFVVASCRATPWARCRRTCCATPARRGRGGQRHERVRLSALPPACAASTRTATGGFPRPRS